MIVKVHKSYKGGMKEVPQEVKCYYYNGKTAIGVSEKAVRILDTAAIKSKTLKSADSAIKVSKELEIELGRNLDEFRATLSLTGIPMVFVDNAMVKKDIEYVQVVRMATDKVPRVTLGLIACCRGVILAYYPYASKETNPDFHRLCGLTRIYQMSIATDYKKEGFGSRYQQCMAKIVHASPGDSAKSVAVLPGRVDRVIEEKDSVKLIVKTVNETYAYKFSPNTCVNTERQRLEYIALDDMINKLANIRRLTVTNISNGRT